jgi:hypothetical protein
MAALPLCSNWEPKIEIGGGAITLWLFSLTHNIQKKFGKNNGGKMEVGSK